MSSLIAKLKKRKKTVIAVVVIIAVLIGIRFMRGGGDGSAANYQHVNPENRDITVSVEGSGVLEANKSRTIMASVTGDVLATYYSVGDTVNEGELILQIDKTDAERTVNSAADTLAQAAVAVDQAGLSISTASVSSQSAAESASYLYVSSNFAGQVTAINFDEGDDVGAGAAVATVVDKDTVLLKLQFHSADADLVSVGSAATISITATGESLAGTVTAVSGVENVGVGGILTREVTISATNPGGITESNMAATARVGELACASGGTFEFNVSKTIYAMTSGTVSSVNVNEGDWVSADQTILTMRNVSVSAAYQSASDSVGQAQLGLTSAELNYNMALRNLETAEDMIDDYDITAPMSGVIASLGFEEGDSIDLTDISINSVLEIYDLSSMKLSMYVDELDISNIKVGQTVLITTDAIENESFEGVVESISISGVTTSGVTNYPVTVRVEDFGALIPGMNVSTEIIVDEVTDVMAIPVEAISRGNTVLVVDSSSSGDTADSVPEGYRRVTIEIGRNDEDYIEVTAGLTTDDLIVIDTSTTSLMEMMAASGPPMG